MDNPNNPYGYPPPPSAYPLPPSPPAKGLLAPPAGKRRGLALAAVCVMALATLASALISNLNPPNIIGSPSSGPMHLALAAANLLLTLLVFLKFLLPGWEPHRKALTWLLGAWVACALVTNVYGFLQGIWLAAQASGELLIESSAIGGAAGGTFGSLYSIAITPQAILLFGLIAKRRTEKLAALVLAISQGLGLLVIPLGLLLLHFAAGIIDLPAELLPASLLSGPMLLSTIAGYVVSLGWVILCFTWPALERPILSNPTEGVLNNGQPE